MQTNTHICFLSHGNTNKNQTINYDKYNSKAIKISKKIYNIIIKYNIKKKIIFYSSPEKRCLDTLHLLKENLQHLFHYQQIILYYHYNLI